MNDVDESNGNGVSVTKTSSVEDVSEYTDAEDSISTPTEILAEFLSSIMTKDYFSALKYCKLILQYEPNHKTAKEFFPLLHEKCSNEEEMNDFGNETSDSEFSNDDEDYTDADDDDHLTDSSSDEESSSSEISSGNEESGSLSEIEAEVTSASYSSLEDDAEIRTQLQHFLKKTTSSRTLEKGNDTESGDS